MREQILEIRKKTVVFASGSMVSRGSGFFRDVATAALLGATGELALFFVAYRLANVFRRLLAETPLSSSVLPHLKECSNPARLYTQLLAFGAVSVACLFGLFFGMALFLMPILSSDWQRIATLTLTMFPSLFFLVGTGINNVFLQEKGYMFPISFSSTLCNCVWIGSLPFASKSSDPALVLSIAVVLGFVLQFIWTARYVLRLYGLSVRGASMPLQRLGAPFLLSLAGIAATQVNNALDPFFARAAQAEAPSYLWYALRIYLLPLSVIGIAYFTASFSNLAELAKKGEELAFSQLTSKSLRHILTFFLPVSALFFFCAEDLLTVVYFRGAFTWNDMLLSALCLKGYSFGLAGACVALFFSNVWYAKKNYRYPALVSAVVVVLNILCNWLFVFIFDLGAPSVALATSCASWVNALLLARLLLFRELLRPLLATGIASCVIVFVPFPEVHDVFTACVHALSVFAVFMSVYFGVVHLKTKKSRA